MRWVLVFQRHADAWWCRWLACGRYKHVQAYAYVPGLKMWLLYDVRQGKTDLVVARDGPEAEWLIKEFSRGADLISMPVGLSSGQWFRVGFWCVPAIKHLIGLRSGALRPDALWRDCIAAGGVPQEPADEIERTAVHPAHSAAAGAG